MFHHKDLKLTSSKDLAPIALFVYNRPEHTRMTVEALARNSEASDSCLFVFSDGAKDSADRDLVKAVRSYLSQIQGFAEVNIIERETNWGLANSIIDGVTCLNREYGRVIVLEDDLQTSPHFLSFINSALNLYQTDQRIGSVSGYMYPIQVCEQIFFRSVPQSWGWGTWERAWELMETDGVKLLKKLEQNEIAEQFNNAGHQPFIKMLKDQIRGKNNSWYVRWSASLFMNKKLTVMPPQSLVRNFGIDGTGTHCAYWRFNPYDVEIRNEQITIPENGDVSADQVVEKKLNRYFFKVRIIRYVNFVYRVLRLGSYQIRMKR
ncbi:MAG: glycosyltransferase family 2 protein [Methylophaga sp.]